jgi:methylglyoxal synthase
MVVYSPENGNSYRPQRNKMWKHSDLITRHLVNQGKQAFHSKNFNGVRPKMWWYHQLMKLIALIAHDEKKASLVEFVKMHQDQFAKFDLVATSTTGGALAEATGLPVRRMLSGPLGGDLQIGAMIAENQISAVFFLRDPLTAHPHEPDISALLKVCDTHNIPLATNLATAEMILEQLEC